MDRLFGGFGFVLKSVFGAPVGAGARFASGDAPGRFARLAGRLLALMLVGFVAVQFSPTQKAAAEVVCSNVPVVDQAYTQLNVHADLATGTCSPGSPTTTTDHIHLFGGTQTGDYLSTWVLCKNNGGTTKPCVTDVEVTNYSGDLTTSLFTSDNVGIEHDIPSDFSDPDLTSTISYKMTIDGIDYVFAIEGMRSAAASPRLISYEKITISGGIFDDVTPPDVQVSNNGPKPAGSTDAQLFSAGSFDADSSIETYLWEQVADPNGTPLGSPTVIFTDNSLPNQTFTIPAGLNNGDSLFFKLTLTDPADNSASKVTTYAVGPDGNAPTYSVTRDGGNPSNASSLAFSVDFSETVQNVDAADFALVKTGTADGDSLVTVSGSVDITDLSGNALNWTLKGIWDFDTADLANIDTGLLASRDTNLRARTEGGFNLNLVNGMQIQASGFYDGFGAKDYASYGGTVTFTIPLSW